MGVYICFVNLGIWVSLYTLVTDKESKHTDYLVTRGPRQSREMFQMAAFIIQLSHTNQSAPDTRGAAGAAPPKHFRLH